MQWIIRDISLGSDTVKISFQQERKVAIFMLAVYDNNNCCLGKQRERMGVKNK